MSLDPRSRFDHGFDFGRRPVTADDLAQSFFQHFVPAGANAGNGRVHFDIREDADSLSRRFVGINTPMPLIMVRRPPGKANGDTFPSAPAVVLPTTMAFGAGRKAMAVYSA
jgi:hypothetical protein